MKTRKRFEATIILSFTLLFLLFADKQQMAAPIDFKVVVYEETQMPQQNKIRLSLDSYVRPAGSESAQWRPVSGASIETDRHAFDVHTLSNLTDSNGSLDITITPEDEYDFFTFVPLANTGIRTPDFAVPLEAISLRTIIFYYFSQGILLGKYPYSVQTYNLPTVIQSFAEKTINPHLRTIKLKIIDEDSRHSITGAEVLIIGDPPTPSQLLKPYFPECRHLKMAIDLSPYYVTEIAKEITDQDGVTFTLWQPFTYRLEIIHPDYFFTARDLDIRPDDYMIIVMLSERYTKVTIVRERKIAEGLKYLK